MATSVKTPSPSPAVTGLRRAALTGYRWQLLAFLLLGTVQNFLAGLGAFRLDHLDASAGAAFAPRHALHNDYSGSQLDAIMTTLVLMFIGLALLGIATVRAHVLTGPSAWASLIVLSGGLIAAAFYSFDKVVTSSCSDCYGAALGCIWHWSDIATRPHKPRPGRRRSRLRWPDMHHRVLGVRPLRQGS